MLTRLMKLSEELGLEFGVKITNTFPVDVTEMSFQAKKCICQVNPYSLCPFLLQPSFLKNLQES